MAPYFAAGASGFGVGSFFITPCDSRKAVTEKKPGCLSSGHTIKRQFPRKETLTLFATYPSFKRTAVFLLPAVLPALVLRWWKHFCEQGSEWHL